MSDYQQDSAAQADDVGAEQNDQGGFGQDRGMSDQGRYGPDQGMSNQEGYGQDQGMATQDGAYGQDQGAADQGGYGQGQGMSRGAGAQGGLGNLLGQAEGMLKGSSDPRAQRAEGLLNQARGILGGGGGEGDAPTDRQSADGDGSTFGSGQ
jgi:hypothetical protein